MNNTLIKPLSLVFGIGVFLGGILNSITVQAQVIPIDVTFTPAIETARPEPAERFPGEAEINQLLTFSGKPAVSKAVNESPTPQNPQPSSPSADPGQAKKDPYQVNPLIARGVATMDGYEPLNGKERVKLYLLQTYSPAVVFRIIGPSIGYQLGEVPPEWGNNFGGFGRRVASTYGVLILQSSFQAAGAAAMGYEPRYVRSSKKGFFKRTGHAFMFNFLTLNRDKKLRIDFPTLISIYGSNMIAAHAWYPDRFTARGDGVRLGNTSLAIRFASNLFQEFLPDIKKIFRRK
ncbi:MAG: hypothetical protein HY774_11785 [Acidobacteria bacterium]|nr:hypothetical protein [Acidobacteriota bacterium]